MSYVRHNWVTDESITAAKLNNMEDGIEEAAQSGGGGGGTLIIHGTWNDNPYGLFFDASYNDIVDALSDGILPVFVYPSQYDDDTTTYVSRLAYYGSNEYGYYVGFDEANYGTRDASATTADADLNWQPSD